MTTGPIESGISLLRAERQIATRDSSGSLRVFGLERSYIFMVFERISPLNHSRTKTKMSRLQFTPYYLHKSCVKVLLAAAAY